MRGRKKNDIILDLFHFYIVGLRTKESNNFSSILYNLLHMILVL